VSAGRNASRLSSEIATIDELERYVPARSPETQVDAWLV
jgi:hypothetical protein